MGLKERLELLREDIPKQVRIVAATKTRTPEEINEALLLGIDEIGENYVTEAEKKYLLFKGKVKIHCIGHIQSNKIKKAVQIFDYIQTVDSEKTAAELDKRCKEIGKVMPVLIEVNIGREENKHGCMPEETILLAKKISTLSNLKLEGLMTMGPGFKDKEELRPYFRKAKELFEKIRRELPKENIQVLSMGMSDSYKIAIEEGSTMVRLGTVLFGERDYKKK